MLLRLSGAEPLCGCVEGTGEGADVEAEASTGAAGLEADGMEIAGESAATGATTAGEEAGVGSAIVYS